MYNVVNPRQTTLNPRWNNIQPGDVKHLTIHDLKIIPDNIQRNDSSERQ